MLGGIFIKSKKIIFNFIFLIVFVFFSGCINVSESNEYNKNDNLNKIEDDKIKNEELEDEFNFNNSDYYTNYDAILNFDETNSKISVIEKINYKNITGKKLNNIYMNICSDFVKEGKIFNISSLTISGREVVYDIIDNYIYIQLNEPILDNSESEIIIQFDIILPDINSNIVCSGNILPTICAYDNYGWNKNTNLDFGKNYFNSIGNYNITINTPENYSVISSGTEVFNINNDVKTTNIKAKLIKDFAFVIGKNFFNKSIKNEANNFSINLYYYSENDILAENILNNINDIFKYYVQNIGNYPYNHIDVVECDLDDDTDKQFTAISLINEKFFTEEMVFNSLSYNLGYQWFDCVLESNFIKEPWLREAVNGFLKKLIYYTNKDIDFIMEKEYIELKENIKNIKYSELNNSIDKYDIKYNFDIVQIKKSIMMIYSLYKIMGEEKFFEFLNSYYTEYSFKFATSNNFFRSAEKIYGRSLYDFFNDWINSVDIPKINFD